MSFDIMHMSLLVYMIFFFFVFKQKTAYEMRISDWSSDVCSSDLARLGGARVTWIYPYGRSVAWEIYAVARLNGDRAFGFWNVGSSDKVHPADYRAVIK